VSPRLTDKKYTCSAFQGVRILIITMIMMTMLHGRSDADLADVKWTAWFIMGKISRKNRMSLVFEFLSKAHHIGIYINILMNINTIAGLLFFVRGFTSVLNLFFAIMSALRFSLSLSLSLSLSGLRW